MVKFYFKKGSNKKMSLYKKIHIEKRDPECGLRLKIQKHCILEKKVNQTAFEV
jgi:hypothetical protein